MFSFFRHAKFRAPLARLRNVFGVCWRTSFAMLGRYRPMRADEMAYSVHDAVPFKGDIPQRSGGVHSQQRLSFREQRPALEAVENLIVTPLGGGWKDGTLYERYSSCRPGLRMLAGPPKPITEVDSGYFIQSEHTDTFGDWMSEYLSPLSHLESIDGPVYLPRAMADKPYVKRDAERLNINFVGVEGALLIRNAQVVRQRRCIRYWRHDDVTALRKLIAANPEAPAPGSLVYLSRHGEASEVANRTHPNLLIEALVRRRGGVVLRTSQASYEDYLNAASEAETVLFDHGSAGYNMVYWRSRRVIELVSDAWWMNSFLFFADALGIRDYSLICSDRGSPDDVASRIERALDAPITPS